MRISKILLSVGRQFDRALVVLTAVIGGGTPKQIRETLADHDRYVAFYAKHPELSDQAYQDGTRLKKLTRFEEA